MTIRFIRTSRSTRSIWSAQSADAYGQSADEREALDHHAVGAGVVGPVARRHQRLRVALPPAVELKNQSSRLATFAA
jgi:hypothetical protein